MISFIGDLPFVITCVTSEPSLALDGEAFGFVKNRFKDTSSTASGPPSPQGEGFGKLNVK